MQQEQPAGGWGTGTEDAFTGSGHKRDLKLRSTKQRKGSATILQVAFITQTFQSSQ